MSRPPIGPNPCLAGCGTTVQRSTPAYALCKACCSASYVAFCRENRDLDPSEWQRRLNRFHSDIQGRVALAQAELAVAV